MEILAQAFTYSSLDWRVVELYGVDKSKPWEPDDPRDEGKYRYACTCPKGAKCKSPGKHPTQSKWQDEASSKRSDVAKWFGEEGTYNLGVCLGPESGIVDIEFDDEEGEATAQRLLDGIETPTFKSGRSVHRLFRFPDGLEESKAVVKVEGLEIRLGTGGRGAQSVFPPSTHASGVEYEWLPGLSPDDVDVADFPATVRDLFAPTGNDDAFVMVCEPDRPTLSNHPGAIEGERNTTCAELVGRWLAQNGGKPTEELYRLTADWGLRCDPPFPLDEQSQVIRGIARNETSTTTVNTRQRKTGFNLISADDVEVVEEQWLWDRRIPLGRVTILAADGGVGKGMVAVSLASILSRGECLPGDNEPRPASTLIISAEDGASDMTARIQACGGDTSRIHFLNSDDGEMFNSFVTCSEALRMTLEATPDIKLVIWDTLPDFMGNVSDDSNGAVRRASKPLIALAEQSGVAMLGLCHFRKSAEGRAGDRLLGSVAYRNIPRSVLYLVKDKDEPDRRLLYHQKFNNSRQADTIAVDFVWEDGDDSPPHVHWDATPVEISDISEYLNADVTSQGSRANETAEWLWRYLTEVGEAEGKEIVEAAKSRGLSRTGVYRAAESLGIAIKKGCSWTLPKDSEGPSFIVTCE